MVSMLSLLISVFGLVIIGRTCAVVFPQSIRCGLSVEIRVIIFLIRQLKAAQENLSRCIW